MNSARRLARVAPRLPRHRTHASPAQDEPPDGTTQRSHDLAPRPAEGRRLDGDGECRRAVCACADLVRRPRGRTERPAADREGLVRRQRPDPPPRGRHPHHPARCVARAPAADRHQEGLRPRPVRCMHRDRRRPSHQRVPHARGDARRREGHDDRGPRRTRPSPPAAGRVRQARWLPVRLLHAGADLLGGRHARRGGRAPRSAASSNRAGWCRPR